MNAYVMDTNVAVVANEAHPEADPECVKACIEALQVIHDGAIIVLDDAMLIISEYRKHLNMSGEPGVGDSFMKWIHRVQADVNHCEQVHLTKSHTHPLGFTEAPDDPALASFDRSDCMFIAAANASTHKTQILNAVDSDWAEHHVALARNGINVKFLCPQNTCPRR